MKDVGARLDRLEEVVMRSRTSKQFEARKKIYDKIKELLENAGDDMNQFYASLIENWECFVAWEFDTTEGVPIFLAPWQIRADRLADQYDTIWVCCARQIGKTVWEAVRALKHMMQEQDCKVVGIAPTTDQLVVRDNIRHFIANSDFIQEEFVGEGGHNDKQHIEFGENGSTFEPMNMSGDHKRGPTANVIMIDEFQLLSPEDYKDIIQPMLTSAYTDRKLYQFMTPSELHWPGLAERWKAARDSDDTLTVNVNAWQALDQGIRKATSEGSAGSMRDTFRDLGVRCPYVEAAGACPGFLPHWFDEDVEAKCEGCFLRNETFLREHMAQFPEKEERFYRSGWLHEARNDDKKSHLTWSTIRELDARVSFGIDLGGLQDPTEVVVNLYWEDEAGVIMLRTVARHVIPSAADNDNIDDNEIVKRLKNMYHTIQPDAIYMDVTRKKNIAKKLVTGEDFIPRSVFYTTSGAERNDLVGVWITNEIKHDFYKNHQKVLMNNRIDVWGPENFWEDYYRQHSGVRQETGRTKYPKYKTPNEDHLVDACVLASGPVLEGVRAPPLNEFELIDR